MSIPRSGSRLLAVLLHRSEVQAAYSSHYVPGFRTGLYYKDMANVVETGKSLAVPLPVSAAVQQLLAALMADGRGGEDYSALARVVFDLAGLDD